MSWQPLNFGKYQCRTLPYVVLKDPDWFFNAWEQRYWDYHRKYLTEATEIYRKARSIKPPKGMVVLYRIHKPTKKFGDFIFISEEDAPSAVNRYRKVKPVIDLSYPRSLKTCDKTGNKLMIDQVKRLILKNGQKNLTEKICEKYFEDDDNFV